MARTVREFVLDILRETRGQGTPLEAHQALQDALNALDARGNWEFLLTAANINVEEPYSTGTVSVTNGTTAVTGSGTTWLTSWIYKSIQFGGRELAYRVATVPSATSLTLVNPLSGTSAIAGGSYVIYQDRYALPTDCEPGRDLFIRGPRQTGDGDGIIRKLARLSFETQSSPDEQSQWPLWYTDDSYDEVNSVATIRLYPYPARAEEYNLIYYRRLSVPTTQDSRVIIPESFERLLINWAASQMMRKLSMQGWVALRAEAEQMMNRLFVRFGASAAYDQRIIISSGEDEIYNESSKMHTRGIY